MYEVACGLRKSWMTAEFQPVRGEPWKGDETGHQNRGTSKS